LRKFVFVVVSLALFACATAVLAQQAPPAGPPPGGQPQGPGGGRQGFQMSCPAMALSLPPAAAVDRATDLNLTDDKKSKLTAALTKNETALAPYRQKAAEATRLLREALMAATFDAAKVGPLLDKAQKADAALANAQIAGWTEVRAILTADQVTQLVGRRGGFGGGNQPGQPNQGGRRTRNQPGTGGGGNAPGAPPEPAPAQ